MSFVPKTAFVLAAGLGTRMRPLTDVIPKPMVRLNDRPLIDHVLDRIGNAGIRTAVVNVHYHADVLTSHLANRRSPSIVISDERDALLDTGGGVVRALDKLGSEPFVIHNSDSVWIEGIGATLPRMFAAWQSDRMDCLMLLASAATSLGYDGHGDFNMSPDGRLTRREAGREAPFVFAGVSIAHPRMFEGAPRGAFSLNRVWDRVIEKDRLYGIRLDGRWMHVGTPQSLAEAEQLLAKDAG